MPIDRRYLYTVGLLVLAAGTVAVAVGNEKPDAPLTPAEQPCMNDVYAMSARSVQADGARALANSKALVGSANLPNSAAIDAAIARIDATNRLAEIQEDTAICSKMASCFPERPFKAAFDACYEEAQRQRASDHKD
jgi:hypothetical protein